MSIETIQFALNQRFAAPLPEFYQRRIIFWQDEDREFESAVDELTLPGVEVVKLTGANNFAVKKLLLHDDLTSNYLIYNPFSYDQPQDNWLLDIELYSEEYRADKISMQMAELNIEPTPAMRKTMKLYSRFFDSKDRMQKLLRIGRTYQAPMQLHVDIMAVLAGLNGGSAQDVFIEVLSGSLDEAENEALINLRKFGSVEAFWQLVQKYTGYIHEAGTPLGQFAAHVLLTALAQTIGDGPLKGLERFVSDSGKAYCYGLVHDWQNSDRSDALYELCRTIEQELQLPTRFDKQEIEVLLNGDVFPAIHESILSRLFVEASERVVRLELLRQTVGNRRTSGWYERFSDYYDCIAAIGEMQAFYQENAGGFHLTEPKKAWSFYTEKGYLMDSAYRRFHYAFGNTLKDSNDLLEDKLKHAADYVEGLYCIWFLSELNSCWINIAGDDLSKLGYVSEVPKQRDFYRHYVRPLTSKNGRAFVIISDALRYEVAAQLRDVISHSTKGNVVLESCQAVFPSITKFGMAALLPGQSLSVTEKIDVLMDGMSTRSTTERQRILETADAKSVAVQYQDLLAMKRTERRELVSGKNVVYIYHNTIDAIGDKAPTENKVFDACNTAVQELSNILRVVVNDLQGTDIFITADHGFLYTYNALTESDKLGKSAFHGEIYETGRRYALTTPDTQADYLLPVDMAEVSGPPIKGYTPRDTTRIKVSGGGENYVHGGVSLQEMVVPVVVFKNLRSTSKGYVEVSNAELKLLSQTRKIANLIFSLDFFQRQPVGEKVQPCTYTIYMADESGKPVSDQQRVIADRTELNDSERVFRVRFNLRSGLYDKKKAYHLVITNGTDVPEEEVFQIDIAFADDFGFDL